MLTLGQSLLNDPTLLMIDELSLGLAPAIVGMLIDVVKQIHASGTTIIVVEQSVNVALTLAQRAVFMEKGEVRFSGPTQELLERPDILRSVFIAGASGEPAAAPTPRQAPRTRSPSGPPPGRRRASTLRSCCRRRRCSSASAASPPSTTSTFNCARVRSSV